MRLRAAVFGLLFAAVPVLARAQPIQGFYIGGSAGYVLPQAIHASPSTTGFGASHLRFEEDGGLAALGSIGYALGGGFRFEVEGDFLRNSVANLARTPFPTVPSGRVRTDGVMVNALYDFDIGSRYVFPYLGMGAGYMWTNMNNVSFGEPGGPFNFSTSAGSGKFAWQAIAGFAFPVPRMPGLSLTAEYRFLDITPGATFTGLQTTASGVRPASLELGQQLSHSFLLGVRYAFHVTPPPPPPAPAPVAAPAPQPARSYLVFFDWDKASLSDRARAIVREAANASTHVQYTQIRVNGYTDTSGSPAYNMRLSLRRARNVAAELVHDGVPRNAIVIHGFGETHLLVPTGPGVREPQNRRVEIVIG